MNSPPAPSQTTEKKQAGIQNPFFAFCMDTHDAKKRSLDEQARMLKELGYAGAGHLWLDDVPERLKTLDKRGLQLFQVYVRVSMDPKQPKYDPRLAELIKLLKGRPTILGVLMSGMKPSDPSGDARAVEILREIGDMAAESGIRVALYPHTGDWIERVEDAVRVVEKVDRKNVGVMFNLCHWMKVDKSRDYKRVLTAAMPHLFVVSINGADTDGENWDRLIQPLDRGTFDIHGFLKTLRDLGYSGPIGLQCYGIPGDAREHLARSIAAWRKLTIRLDAEKQDGSRTTR
jgi:sugar phosphate isomerase/epimerase